ncbi:RNA-guided endonuclease InsQ/TnpB family protein [Streptomyces sp. NPDC001935]
MYLRYSFRLEPTPGQRIALARTLGCARVVYNDALAARKAAYRADKSRIPTGALARQVITEAKRTPERAWLAAVSVDALQSSLRDLDTAYANFFASVAGKRPGRRMGLPVFKSKKDSRQAVRFSRNGFRLRDNGRLNLAKIGDVRVRWSRELTYGEWHGNHLDPCSQDSPDSALASIADAVQDTVMELLWQVWPLCPEHGLGMHLTEDAEERLSWWCVGERLSRGPARVHAAVGGLDALGESTRKQ